MIKVKKSLIVGIGFGFTSAIITTLGLMIGLYSSTNSKLAVIGGILTIAIADAFSDALGIHVSQEAQKGKSTKQIWESTIATFLAKFFLALTFIVALLIFSLSTAIIVNIIYGLLLLSLMSWMIAVRNKTKVKAVVGEHLFISLLVIIITNIVGKLIAAFFR